MSTELDKRIASVRFKIAYSQRQIEAMQSGQDIEIGLSDEAQAAIKALLAEAEYRGAAGAFKEVKLVVFGTSGSLETKENWLDNRIKQLTADQTRQKETS